MRAVILFASAGFDTAATAVLFRAGKSDNTDLLVPIGFTTALFPEAADASASGITPVDGQSGDTDFPFGNIKALFTVGAPPAAKITRFLLHFS